jgi:uncharacterized protein
MKWRTIRRWLAFVCALALIALLVTAWIVGGALVAPANRTVYLPRSDLPIVATTLPSASGSTLATWYIPAEHAHATIILLHAIHGDRRAMWGRAMLFHQAGYGIVMVDLQAHGESPGEHITLGCLERHDVRAAVDFARRMNPRHRIGIVGCSLGGAAALLASPLDIDAAVLESVYPTVSEAVHDRIAIRVGPFAYVLSPLLLWQLPLRMGVYPSDLRPIDHIGHAGCPVLVAGGDLDQHTTLGETQGLFAAAKSPKKLVIFRGAAHVDLLDYDPQRYENEVLPFLANCLAGPQAERQAAQPPS